MFRKNQEDWLTNEHFTAVIAQIGFLAKNYSKNIIVVTLTSIDR
jgi:hypothetical protein